MRKTSYFTATMLVFKLLSLISPSIFAADNISAEQFETGMEYYEKHDYDRAFSYFMISGGVKEYAPAQNMLGVCFRDGLGTNRNLSEAERYFRLAAAQGDPDAIVNLALILTPSPSPAPTEPPFLEKEKSEVAALSVGDIILFGHYEQDNNFINGKEDIEWYVVAQDDGIVMLLSSFALDRQSYNNEWTDVTWETCSLREWLNEDFLEGAFSEQERKKIVAVKVNADKNPDYKTDPGQGTVDQVFALSVNEFESLPEKMKICSGTAYCYTQGVHESQNRNCSWWLRTPGWYQKSAVDVNNKGVANYDEHKYKGYNVNHRGHGVRPVIWIDLRA